MVQPIPLSALPCGKGAVVHRLETTGSMRRRLLDIGLTPGSRVRALFQSCSGDPTAYEICGSVIALRREDAATVLVRVSDKP